MCYIIYIGRPVQSYKHNIHITAGDIDCYPQVSSSLAMVLNITSNIPDRQYS